jgi:hypothetical protein
MTNDVIPEDVSRDLRRNIYEILFSAVDVVLT